MKKKLLSVLLAVCLLVSAFAVLSVGAHATEHTGKCGKNITWTYDDVSYKLTLTGSGEMYNYDSSDNKAPWYRYHFNIESVFVGGGITSIGDHAFEGLIYCNEFSIPNTLTRIGVWSFRDCHEMNSMTIPDGVREIGELAFSFCKGLKSVTIPDSVTEIGDFLFLGCESLESIVIPGSIKTVTARMFDRCSALKTATLKKGVETIAANAFLDCTSLTTVYLPSSLKAIRTLAFDTTPRLSDVYYDGTEKQWNAKVDVAANNQYLQSATMHFNADNSIDEYTLDLSTGDCVIPFKDLVGYLMFTFMAAEEDGKMKAGVDTDSNTVIDVQNDGSYDIKYSVKSIGSETMIRFSLLDGNSFGGKDYDYDMSEEAENWLLDQSNTLYTRKIRFIVMKNPFTDVPEGKWYTNAVLWCYAKGYMTGTSATTFEPGSPFTRAMFVTVLAKIDGANTDGYTGSSFTDVPEGKWYSKPIQWAFRKEYASGLGNGKFGPNDPVTREQIAQFLYNYSQKKGYSTSGSVSLGSYPDGNKVSNYAKNAVAWAVGNGLISGVKAGDTVYLQPKGTATRAQVALIVKNYVEKFVK